MIAALVFGAIAAGASLLGSAMNAVGTYKASQAQEQEAREAARQTRLETGWKIADLQVQQKQFRGTQMALIGRSGVSLSSGSPLALMGETSRRQIEDVRRLKQQGEWEAESLLTQAEMYKKTRPWQLAGSLLGGLSSAAGTMSGVL